MLGASKLEEKMNLFFLKLFEKITKNVIRRKLQGFVTSDLEAESETPGSAMKEPQYRDANFKLCKLIYN